jgi:formylglycine-generating enzyme required for sulfatase activity
MEQNGTFDMMGNVWEWNDTEILYAYYSGRILRGGSYTAIIGTGNGLGSSYRGDASRYYEDSGAGFRIASIPEPATLFLLGLGGLALLRKRRT